MDTVGTKFIVVDSTHTLPQILAEGRRLLEAGDKPRALAYFITATQLAPDDESVWLLRAEATEDPEQLADCLEQILRINPDNVQARSKLMAWRVSALQAEAKTGNNAAPAPESKPGNGILPLAPSSRRWVIGGIIAVVAACVLLGIGVPLFAILSTSKPDSGASDAAAADKSATQSAAAQQVTLPATWTPTAAPTPTQTPLPTPTPAIKTKGNVTLRSGPGTAYGSLGTLPAGRTITVVGRSPDGKYYQIQYPDATKFAWVLADSIDLGGSNPATIPSVASVPPPPPPPVVKPTAKPTDTPVPPYDFILGRGLEYIADCGKPWKVMGSVYDSQSSAQRVNGVLVRVWAFGQVQATLTSGSPDATRPGYWEWVFNSGSEVLGEVAVVNLDGSRRSQPVGFHLTSRCDGTGAVNEIVIDFAGRR
jgi:hypothetical protein